MTARQSAASNVMQRPAQPAADSRVSSAEAALAVLRIDLLGEDERLLVGATASRVAEADVYVVAVGEFKRGKSSLLNALIGEQILPVGVVPLTAVVTVLKRGQSEAVGVHADGRRGVVDAARLADYVTEEGNPGNRLGLSRVEVASPGFALPPGAVLIDTPGLRSVVDGGEDHTLDFLPQVDVALMVLSVDQPLSGDEQDLAARLRDQGAEIVFVLNKTDYLSPAETEQAKSFVAERLRLSGFSDAALFAVSSKRAAQNDDADGVPRLQDYLTALLERRHDAIRRDQSDRRVRRLLDELQMSYAVQREVAGSAEEKLTHALRELEGARERIARMAEEQDAIFAHRIQAAERKLSDEMSAFRQTLEAALLGEIEGLAGERKLDEQRVDEVLRSTIEASWLNKSRGRAWRWKRWSLRPISGCSPSWTHWPRPSPRAPRRSSASACLAPRHPHGRPSRPRSTSSCMTIPWGSRCSPRPFRRRCRDGCAGASCSNGLASARRSSRTGMPAGRGASLPRPCAQRR